MDIHLFAWYLPHMAYELFLFDLDDTLLDFQTSERESLTATLKQLGIHDGAEAIYETYRAENLRLWGLLEKGKTTKQILRLERFINTFDAHQVDLDPHKASQVYLEILPEAAHLIDHATEICEYLSQRAEVGVITNGVSSVQKRRLEKSGLLPFFSFVAVSDESGFVKPDSRFFQYATHLAKSFKHNSTLMIGDRIEADIEGAHNFGINSCHFNPGQHKIPDHVRPHHTIQHLSELRNVINFNL